MMAGTNGTMRPMTPPQLRAHLQRTLKRALEMALAEKVERVEYGLYLVPSTTRGGLVHTVTGTEPPLACTCEARFHMPLCVHRAAVLVRRWRAEGSVVALDDGGDVVVVTKTDAAALAYPAEAWPALVLAPPEPPPGRYDDRPLDLDDLELVLPEEI